MFEGPGSGTQHSSSYFSNNRHLTAWFTLQSFCFNINNKVIRQNLKSYVDHTSLRSKCFCCTPHCWVLLSYVIAPLAKHTHCRPCRPCRGCSPTRRFVRDRTTRPCCSICNTIRTTCSRQRPRTRAVVRLSSIYSSPIRRPSASPQLNGCLLQNLFYSINYFANFFWTVPNLSLTVFHPSLFVTEHRTVFQTLSPIKQKLQTVQIMHTLIHGQQTLRNLVDQREYFQIITTTFFSIFPYFVYSQNSHLSISETWSIMEYWSTSSCIVWLRSYEMWMWSKVIKCPFRTIMREADLLLQSNFDEARRH